MKPARIASVRLGEHDGFILINGRNGLQIRATPEQPFLIRRDETWGFASAELLQIGDALVIDGDREGDPPVAEETIASLARLPGRVRTVALHIPGTNTFIADGAWTHNDSGPQFTVSLSA